MSRPTYKECSDYMVQLSKWTTLEEPSFIPAFKAWLEENGWTMDEYYQEGLKLYKDLTGKDWEKE